MTWLSVFLLLSFSAAAGQHAADKSCIIVHQHQHKFGENMSRLASHKPYDYIEGEYPKGMKFRSELNDKSVQQVKNAGGTIVILKPDYSRDDLNGAREQCKQFQAAP